MQKTTERRTGIDTPRGPQTWMGLAFSPYIELVMKRNGVLHDGDMQPLDYRHFNDILFSILNGQGMEGAAKLHVFHDTNSSRLDAILEEMGFTAKQLDLALVWQTPRDQGPQVGDRVIVAKWHQQNPTEFRTFEVKVAGDNRS